MAPEAVWFGPRWRVIPIYSIWMHSKLCGFRAFRGIFPLASVPENDRDHRWPMAGHWWPTVWVAMAMGPVICTFSCTLWTEEGGAGHCYAKRPLPPGVLAAVRLHDRLCHWAMRVWGLSPWLSKQHKIEVVYRIYLGIISANQVISIIFSSASNFVFGFSWAHARSVWVALPRARIAGCWVCPQLV